MSEAKPNKLDWHRAIVTGGHLRGLRGLESKALDSIFDHADYETCEAYPAMATIAWEIGTDNVHRARQAVSALERKGLLKRIADSRGHNTIVRQLTIPTGTESVPVRKASGTESDAQPVRFATSYRDGLRTPTGTESVPRISQNKSGNKSGNKSERGEDEPVVIPLPLQTEAFRTAWGEWQTHRKQKRQTLTPLAAKKQLKALAEMGEARAIAAIEHSIKAGWTGIFEEQNHDHESRSGSGIQRDAAGKRADRASREYAENLKL